MKITSSAFSILPLVLLLQGCFAFPYETTPKVSGRVLDTVTDAPIANAAVGFRDRSRVHTTTDAGGRFALPVGHNWGPAFLIPFEFTPCGGLLSVEARGYRPVTIDLGLRAYGPIVRDVRLIPDSSPAQGGQQALPPPATTNAANL